jgi:hypothetical protein
MSLPSSTSGDGRPADDEGRSFTTGIGSMVAPAADEEDEETTPPPPRPTFTARASGPAVTPVPGQAPAPDDTAEPEVTAEPDDTAEPEVTVPTVPALGPDDGTPAEPDVAPDAGAVPEARAVPEADDDLASADGDRTLARPLTSAAGLDEPLLSDADGFRLRWQRAQAGFIDDPREAVGEAADLIEQTAQALVGSLRQRQRELRVLWERGPADDTGLADDAATVPGADTEHLRLMMQRYRALFNQLCRP